MFNIPGVQFGVRPNGTHSYYYKEPVEIIYNERHTRRAYNVRLVDDPKLKGTFRKITNNYSSYPTYEDTAEVHHTLTVDTRRNRLIYTIKQPVVANRKHRKENHPPYVIRHEVRVYWIQLDPFMLKCKRTGKGWRTETISSGINTTLMRTKFFPILEYIFGSTNMLKGIAPNLPKHKELPYWSRPLWNGRTTQEAKKLFGWNNSTVMQALNDGVVLESLKNLKIFDGIVGFEIAWACTDYTVIEQDKNINKLQKEFFRKLPLKFLKGIRDRKTTRTEVVDTLRMYISLDTEQRNIDFTNIRNWRELHDHLVKIRRKKENQVYDYSGFSHLTKMEEHCIDGFSVRLPKDTNEVEDWGTDQRHCIGGYARSHLHKEGKVLKGCVLFGMYKDNTLLYCVMLNSKYVIQQFYGKYNSTPHPDHKLVLNKYLEILKKEYYKEYGTELYSSGA